MSPFEASLQQIAAQFDARVRATILREVEEPVRVRWFFMRLASEMDGLDDSAQIDLIWHWIDRWERRGADLRADRDGRISGSPAVSAAICIRRLREMLDEAHARIAATMPARMAAISHLLPLPEVIS